MRAFSRGWLLIAFAAVILAFPSTVGWSQPTAAGSTSSAAANQPSMNFASWWSVGTSTIQIVIVGLGLWVANRNLITALNTSQAQLRNAQAQMYNQMLIQGREMQWKHLELFLSEATDKTRREKKFRGMLISYYSSCFELMRVLDMPQSTKNLLEADIIESMKNGDMQKVWAEIRYMYSKEFIEYINTLGVKTS